ncbi:MAG: MerR family transcriptional regulator, partial [Exiguobacterium sp.]
MARHYSTGEVARKLIVSVRTLRYYDQINFVTPSYTNDVQKRFYSDDEMFRLQKIMLLKSMTVPLDEIRRILEEESLTSILSAHLSSLEEKIEGLKQAQNHTVTLLQSMNLENEKIDWTKLQTIQAKSNDRKQWTDYFSEEES